MQPSSFGLYIYIEIWKLGVGWKWKFINSKNWGNRRSSQERKYYYFKLLTNQALIIKTAILSHCLKVNLKMKKKTRKGYLFLRQVLIRRRLKNSLHRREPTVSAAAFLPHIPARRSIYELCKHKRIKR